MGTLSVNLDILANKKIRSVSAMVDTGAGHSVIPANLLYDLGVVPTGNVCVEFANGESRELPRGEVQLAIDHLAPPTTCAVLFGESDAVLLGASALEVMYLMVDPTNRRLVRQEKVLVYGCHEGIERKRVKERGVKDKGRMEKLFAIASRIVKGCAWGIIGFLFIVLFHVDGNAQESLPFRDEAPSTKKIERTAENIKAGEAIYIKRCLPCHGEKGASDGATAIFLNPRPRDFTRGIFKLKTTVLDEPPTDEDHFRIVTRGVPGTAMPSWETLLSEEERWQVIFYEQETFFPEDRKDPSKRPAPITIPPEPPNTPESIKKGGELFHSKATCFICHGNEGRGDGPLALTIRDIWGNPQLPRDFTRSWQFKGGRDPKDIFTRITTGIFASGMPSFKDQLTDEERWDVAHYVRSLQKELKPAGSDIRPKKITGEIPLDPNDPIWEGVDYIDVKMSGQVTVPPRMQTPAIDLMTVRAIYNDNEVAFHLTWDDRRANTTHQEPPPMKEPGSEGYTTYPVLYPPENRPGPYRDAVAVQMAVKIPNSPELPHFVAGSLDKPVNLWQWKADWNEDTSKPTPVELLISKGHKKPVEATKIQNVMGKGVFKDGQWKAVLKRPLASEDPSTVTAIEAGKVIPVSFHAWEGNNGEVGFQRSLSSWFFLVIPKEVPKTAYAYTFGMILLAFGLEFFFIKKAKRKF